MTIDWGMATQAAAAAALAGLAGLAVVVVIGRRWPTAAALMTPILVVVAVIAGVAVGAWSMTLKGPTLQATWTILTAVLPIALVIGVLMARRTFALQRDAAREAAARQADAVVEAKRRDMIAWVSHDLRTPLAGIQAMVEALQDDVAPDPTDYYQRILDAVDRESRMIDDLLALSRLHGGEAALHFEALSVRDLLSDAIADIQPVARLRRIELVGDCDPSVTVVADGDGLTRAMQNLLSNAVGYSAELGTVCVGASSTGSWTTVRVADSCGGLPEGDLTRVFEPGWRGSVARTPDGRSGAGLGLAVVAGMAEALGGTARVHNEGPGCVFELILPSGS